MDNWFARKIVEDAALYGQYAFGQPKPFVPGVTYIPPSGKVIGAREVGNAVQAVLEGVLTEGPWVTRFEQAMARFLGVPHASMCNSGSSANLLAIAALTSEKVPAAMRLERGVEVVTASCGFPTTLNAILHNGLKPVLIDVELGTYVPSLEQIQEAVGPETGAVFLAHTLGNPFPLDIAECLHASGIPLIEDNCDALGSLYKGQRTGSFGIAATQSFYPAHHITTGEGGMVLTSHGRVRQAVESFRDWGRDCWCEPGKENTCNKRFEHGEFPTLPYGYDHKYICSEVGYNLKSTDIQAAIGLAQMERLPGFIKARRANFDRLYEDVKDLEQFFILPRATEGSEPSWFGFPLTLRDEFAGARPRILNDLNAKKIGTRNLFGGSLLRQPAYYRRLVDEGGAKIVGGDRNSAFIMERTFWIGCWPGLSGPMIDFVLEALHDVWK